MENNIQEQAESSNKMDRRKALVSSGKYAAFTALAMMSVLAPKSSAAASDGKEVPSRLPQKR
jgi:hypothetical protein